MVAQLPQPDSAADRPVGRAELAGQKRHDETTRNPCIASAANELRCAAS